RQSRPSQGAELQRQGCPFRVAGQVFRRITDRDQRLLEDPAMRRLNEKALLIDALAKELANLGLPNQLFQERTVRADQPQVLLGALQPHSAITADQLGDVRRQIGRQWKLAVPAQDLD